MYLEEKEETDDLRKTDQHPVDDLNKSELIELVKNLKEELTPRQLNLSEIEKKFSIEKFNAKKNAGEWLADFEAECDRYRITESQKRVETLKLFLDGSAKEWYISKLRELNKDNWTDWKTSFLKVFTDRGWSNIRYAMAFRYQIGSIVDYALKKHRFMCLIQIIHLNSKFWSYFCVVVRTLPLTLSQ